MYELWNYCIYTYRSEKFLLSFHAVRINILPTFIKGTNKGSLPFYTEYFLTLFSDIAIICSPKLGHCVLRRWLSGLTCSHDEEKWWFRIEEFPKSPSNAFRSPLKLCILSLLPKYPSFPVSSACWHWNWKEMILDFLGPTKRRNVLRYRTICYIEHLPVLTK